MAIDIPMPKLGLTMEEATIIEWLVDEGTEVEADQPILLIETDKTETEVGSPGPGRLHQLGLPGEVFPCGQMIGLLLQQGEAPPARAPTGPAPTPVAATANPAVAAATAALATAEPATANPAMAAAGTGGRLLASPNARRVATERGVTLALVRGTGPGGRIVSEDVTAAADAGTGAIAPVVGAPTGPGLTAVSGTTGFAVATVAARQLADLLGVDLRGVPADPRQQRVTRDGVAAHVRALLQQLAPAPVPAVPTAAPAAPAVAAPAPVASAAEPAAPAPPAPVASAPLLQEPTETVRLTGMRGTIARRMHASLQAMAQLTLTMDADMTAVVADRAARRDGGGGAPSVTDYVVAAAARALTRHPRLNAQVTGAGIALLPEVHVSLAVAVEHGLLVPVVRDTVHRSLAELAAETARLARAAHDGTISPAELAGGTFTVSALGAQGVDMFTPVINPPNAAILGVGRLRDDLVLVDGAVATTKRLTLSLTWDHRVTDGVPAAEFCRTIVALLATPAELD